MRRVVTLLLMVGFMYADVIVKKEGETSGLVIMAMKSVFTQTEYIKNGKKRLDQETVTTLNLGPFSKFLEKHVMKEKTTQKISYIYLPQEGIIYTIQNGTVTKRTAAQLKEDLMKGKFYLAQARQFQKGQLEVKDVSWYVKEEGDVKTIAGYPCKKYTGIITFLLLDKQKGQTMHLNFILTQWLASLKDAIKTYAEEDRKFYEEWSKAMGLDVREMEWNIGWIFDLMGLDYTDYRDDFKKFMTELEGIYKNGYPLETVFSWECSEAYAVPLLKSRLTVESVKVEPISDDVFKAQ